MCVVCVSITSVTSSSPIEMSNERLSRGCTPKIGSQTKVISLFVKELQMYMYRLVSDVIFVICNTLFKCTQ